MTTKKNVRVSNNHDQQPDSYKIVCFLCLRPMDKVGGIARYSTKQRTEDGRDISIRYEICPVCAETIRNPPPADGILDGLVNYFTIRLRLQLEPLAERIMEWETNR